jgi:L-methionine (R)-S-oxide reductase
MGKPTNKKMQVSSHIDATQAKPAFYQELCEKLGDLLGTETDFVANAANTSAFLFHSLPDVNWVGFYLFKDGALVLAPFQGKPACARIELGKSVCGTAARKKESVIVPDVSKFKGHIVCDVDSKSEIAVPLLNWGKLIAILDVDSASLKRFDEDDQEGLEALASVFVASLLTEDLPDLSDLAQ